MKTIVELQTKPAPFTYPALLQCGDGTVVFADTSKTGVVLVGTPTTPVGYAWHSPCGADFVDVGWRPILAPYTIAFDPTV
jgi:hypothetical protein